MYCERAQIHWDTQRERRTSALKIKLFVGFDHKRDGVWPSVKRAIGLVTYLAFWN
jgi:hypothetical protein